MMRELKLVSFIKFHQNEVNSLQKAFVELFNSCGRQYNDSGLQLALTGSIIALFLKNSKMPNSEIKKLLENLITKFK